MSLQGAVSEPRPAALPEGIATEATLAAVKARTDNLDVLLSTRTKPADTQKVDGSAVTQPVSGVFWPPTQPVSAAALPLPAGAATETTLAAIKACTDKIPASPATDRTTAAAPGAVRLSDGTVFYKPTTPADTQPVSGTFWQATQPVSGTVTANAGSGTFTVGGALTANPPTITKGTQGATGYTTQDLKDAGRAVFGASAVAAAAVTAEALLSLTPQRDGTNGTAATSLTVTAGKRLRLVSLVVSVRLGAAAANWSRFVLRMSATGAVTATSPVVAAVEPGIPAAVSGLGSSQVIPLDLELSGTQQLGVSHVALATTNVHSVSLVGYEY